MTKLIAFRATERDQELIEAERARLVEHHNGAPVTTSTAIRSLLGHVPASKELAAA